MTEGSRGAGGSEQDVCDSNKIFFILSVTDFYFLFIDKTIIPLVLFVLCFHGTHHDTIFFGSSSSSSDFVLVGILIFWRDHHYALSFSHHLTSQPVHSSL